MILLSRKKQFEILDVLRPVMHKREALDIVQKRFRMSLLELLLYIRDTKEYNIYLKHAKPIPHSSTFTEDQEKDIIELRKQITELYNNQMDVNDIARIVELDKYTLQKHLCSLRRQGLVGNNRKRKET